MLVENFDRLIILRLYENAQMVTRSSTCERVLSIERDIDMTMHVWAVSLTSSKTLASFPSRSVTQPHATVGSSKFGRGIIHPKKHTHTHN
jgi:hypothetical protein